MEIKYQILPPEMPNFLRVDTNLKSKRQDGLKEPLTIPIADLTKEQAEQFGEIMKQEFIKHWEKKSIIQEADNKPYFIKRNKC